MKLHVNKNEVAREQRMKLHVHKNNVTSEQKMMLHVNKKMKLQVNKE